MGMPDPEEIEATLAKVDALDEGVGAEVRALVEALLEDAATLEAAIEADEVVAAEAV